MFVGLWLPQLGEIVDVGLIRDYTIRARELGFDSMWVQEHLLFASDSDYPTESGGTQRSVYETVYSPLELLAAVTAWAPGMGIGSSVLVAGYHQPAPLANRLATLASSEYVQEARSRGVEGVVIDTNFDTSITDAASWLAQLEDLAGALV